MPTPKAKEERRRERVWLGGGGVGVVGSKRYKWDVKLEVFK